MTEIRPDAIDLPPTVPIDIALLLQDNS